MILSGRTIRELGIITPHESRTVRHGLSGGESFSGYDVHLQSSVRAKPGHTVLASTREFFRIPRGIMCRFEAKSTLIRLGICPGGAPGENGWFGHITLEITYQPVWPLKHRRMHWLGAGTPIAQVIFEQIEGDCEPYHGKYQNQPARPVAARFE